MLIKIFIALMICFSNLAVASERNNMELKIRGAVRDVVIKWAKRTIQSQDDIEEMTNEIMNEINFMNKII